MGNVDDWVIRELVEVVVRGGRNHNGVKWVWIGTKEEADRVKMTTTPCHDVCPCLKHIVEFRERNGTQADAKVAECSAILLSLGATLPEDDCTAEEGECRCGLVTEVHDYGKPAKYERFKLLIG